MPTFHVVFEDENVSDQVIICDEVVLRSHLLICHQFQNVVQGRFRQPVTSLATAAVASVVLVADPPEQLSLF